MEKEKADAENVMEANCVNMVQKNIGVKNVVGTQSVNMEKEK